MPPDLRPPVRDDTPLRAMDEFDDIAMGESFDAEFLDLEAESFLNQTMGASARSVAQSASA